MLLNQLALLAETRQPAYKISWHGYPGNPKPQTVDMVFFADDNGFSADDRANIKALAVGEDCDIAGYADHVTVRRLS